MISLLGFINSSQRRDYDLPGNTRLGIWAVVKGVVVKVGEIAMTFLTVTWDVCIQGPKGFALASITLELTTLV